MQTGCVSGNSAAPGGGAGGGVTAGDTQARYPSAKQMAAVIRLMRACAPAAAGLFSPGARDPRLTTAVRPRAPRHRPPTHPPRTHPPHHKTVVIVPGRWLAGV